MTSLIVCFVHCLTRDLIRVDLPTPGGPTTATIYGGGTWRVVVRSIGETFAGDATRECLILASTRQSGGATHRRFGGAVNQAHMILLFLLL